MNLPQTLVSGLRTRPTKLRNLFGDNVSTNTLPMELADLKRRQAKLHQALEAAKKADAKRAKRKSTSQHAKRKGSSKRAAKVPVAAVDGERGMIVDADVLNEMNEAQAVIPTVEQVEAAFEQRPEQFLADSTFATGGNLSNLADRGIEAVMPVEQTKLLDENPAQRTDPTAPVAESDWPKLPRGAQTGKLDRSAFIYDVAKDCYYCPLGRALAFDHIKCQGRDTCEAS